MDWLAIHWANIDCRDLKVILKNQGGQKGYFCGERLGREYSIISIMMASKLLRQGCIGYLCYATEVKDEDIKIENIPIVCEFPNVFPGELSGLLPQREIDFDVGLISGA